VGRGASTVGAAVDEGASEASCGCPKVAGLPADASPGSTGGVLSLVLSSASAAGAGGPAAAILPPSLSAAAGESGATVSYDDDRNTKRNREAQEIQCDVTIRKSNKERRKIRQLLM